MEIIFETFSFITNPKLQETLLPVQLIFVVIGLGILLFILFALVRTRWVYFLFLVDFTEFLTSRPYGLRKMLGRWQKIQARLETANEAEYKLAIIEADGMLNEILLRLGFIGETLGDRLKSLSNAIIPNLDDVWKAHQVRNDVVHDPDYRLPLEEAQRTLAIYEVVFLNLDLI